MDDSVCVLISMSPKCNKNVKQTKRIKAPSRLALKKSIRRSSVYCKQPPLNAICIADDSSSESSKSSSNNVIDDLPKKIEALNILSDTKVQSIKQWISDIPSEVVDETTEFNNVSIFSQVSAIHSDLSRPKSDNGPTNSTFINSDSRTCFKFDQLFKKKTPIEEQIIKNGNKISDDIEIIEDTDEENDKDNSFKTAIDNSDDAPNKENNKNQNNIVFNTPKPVAEYDECESLLDEVYGESWRKDKERILPQSEPRIHKPKKTLHKEIPKTEIKPRKKYNNPYTDAEQKQSRTLLQKLTEDRLRNTIENSPWRQKLNDLCDSDTDSNSSVKRVLPKTKLLFDEDVQPKSTPITKKNNIQFNKQTANDSFSDFSDSGLTLEEKLKGKAKATPKEKPKTKITRKLIRRASISSNDSFDNDKQLVNEKDKRHVDKPEKTPRTRQLSISSESSEKSWSDFSGSSSDAKEKPKGKSNIFPKSKPSQTGPASFLASLSKSVPDSRCDASARIFRNNYKTYKDQLLQKLFKLYNEKIFGNAISEDSPIEWSDRMTGTAGYCVCRKISHKNGKIERKVRFKLSTKILDSADRLRDTFVHELCHAATWIVNEVSDGHGPFWKSWACKAMRTFPELPAIKRCHDYAINTKYTYKCMGCGYSFGRHSKSLDLERKRCGHCYGKFEVLINKTTKNGEIKSVPSVKKQPTGFALFVKENYSKYKTDNLKNKDVMKLLGQKFKDLKVDQNSK